MKKTTMKTTIMKTTGIALFAASAAFLASWVQAAAGAAGHHHDAPKVAAEMHEGEHHQDMMQSESMGDHTHAMGSLTGKPGDEQSASRVIQVTANDSMRFTHEPLSIKDGETIKFVVTNKGAIAHEFAIGTKDEHREHGQMMMDNPTMHHAPGGNVITINPGETQFLIWTFENAWQIEAACNIPGHYQAGMHSPVTIETE